MLGSKRKEKTGIDPEQREMIENAQRRIKQKRGLFTHFIVFLVGAIGLIIISKVLMQNEPMPILGVEWWIWLIFIWLLLLLYHAFSVFVTKRLLGPEWEKKQYDKLVQKQQERVVKLEEKIEKNHPLPAISNVEQDSANHGKQLTMIAAMDGNMGLGKENDLVWHLPDDFQRFKKLTSGHYIIMGRKTFESLPGKLPNRTHIVITRDENYKAEGAIVTHDLETAIAAASDDDQPFIIGGGEIYKQALEKSNRLELTRVHHVFDVDTYFPEFRKRNWKLLETRHHPADERHKYAFDYETWVRR